MNILQSLTESPFPENFLSTATVVSETIKVTIANNIEQIAKNALELPSKIQEQQPAKDFITAYTILKKEAESLIKKTTQQEVGETLITELALQSAPNKEAYFQVLCQNAPYCEWKVDHVFPKSEFFDHPSYKIKKIVEYEGGIKILIITSEDLKEAPLMIFRGTDGNNIHNIADDFNLDIGVLNYTRHKEELERELETLTTNHGRCHIMGHSYGGAVAQLITCKYPQLIKRCTYHNSPSVGEKAVEEFRSNISKLGDNTPKPEVWSYRHARDLASLLGGTPLPTDEGRNYTLGKSDDNISHIDAHSLNTLFTDITKSNDLNAPYYLLMTAIFMESTRKDFLSKTIPFFQYINELRGVVYQKEQAP